MNLFKLRAWMVRHSDKILGLALATLILNSVVMALNVFKNDFQVFDYSFWIWALSLVNWITIQDMLQE